MSLNPHGIIGPALIPYVTTQGKVLATSALYLKRTSHKLKLLVVVNKAQIYPVNTRCGTHHIPTHITQSIKLGYHTNSSDFWVMVAALKVISKWHWWHLLFFTWIWYWHPIRRSQVIIYTDMFLQKGTFSLDPKLTDKLFVHPVESKLGVENTDV